MLKSLFNYHYKNIEILSSQVFASAMVVNVITPSFLVYIMSPLLSSTHLYIWLFAHISIGLLRIIHNKRFFIASTSTQKEINTAGNIYLIFVFLTALLYGYMMWVAVLIEAPTIYIMMVSTTIVALSAGSISTLVSVFLFFGVFVVVGMLLQIAAFFYINDTQLNIYASVLFIFLLMLLKAGYQQYQVITNLNSIKEAFQTIYDKAFDGIALTKNNRFKDCNPAILKMFHFESKKDFLNGNIQNLMPKYQEDGSLSMKKMVKMAKIALKNGHNSFEWQYKKSDGTLFWVDIVLTKIFIDGEELIHGVYRDISYRKEIEENEKHFKERLQERVKEEISKNRLKDKALLQQNKLAQMGEMISMIAHQWRQPLSAISATSVALELKAELETLDKDTTIELSNKITTYSQHLSTTIDDFRNFFKEDKQKEETTFEEILNETVDIVKITLDNLNITLDIEYKSKRTLYTYKNELKQVVLNIIKNAIDILQEKNIETSKITIVVNENTLVIADNAGGIPEKIMDKIFNPYFSTKTKKDGTGLGLYMSKTIIEDHCRGRLSVENNVDGALFTIDLKVTDD